MSFHYSDEEHKEISRLLEKNLGPEFLSQRAGPAGKLTYIEGRVAINMANSIFGFNGWNSEVKDCTVDYVNITIANTCIKSADQGLFLLSRLISLRVVDSMWALQLLSALH
jgi:recombination DNA repair RAD52 pathway protein